VRDHSGKRSRVEQRGEILAKDAVSQTLRAKRPALRVAQDETRATILDDRGDGGGRQLSN